MAAQFSVMEPYLESLKISDQLLKENKEKKAIISNLFSQFDKSSTQMQSKIESLYTEKVEIARLLSNANKKYKILKNNFSKILSKLDEFVSISGNKISSTQREQEEMYTSLNSTVMELDQIQ